MEMIEGRTKRPVQDEAVSLKVSSHWKLIKAAINQKGSDDPKKLDKKQPLVVGHGAHSVTSVPSDKNLEFVAQNTFNDNYVGVDSEGKVTVFLSTGYKQSMDKNLSDPLRGLVYATKTKHYVAWGNDDNLRVSCKISQSRCHSGFGPPGLYPLVDVDRPFLVDMVYIR